MPGRAAWCRCNALPATFSAIPEASSPVRNSICTPAYWRGVNNRIKVIKRMAYGFRDVDYFFLKIKAAFPGKMR